MIIREFWVYLYHEISFLIIVPPSMGKRPTREGGAAIKYKRSIRG